jgi:hypothetical protein
MVRRAAYLPGNLLGQSRSRPCSDFLDVGVGEKRGARSDLVDDIEGDGDGLVVAECLPLGSQLAQALVESHATARHPVPSFWGADALPSWDQADRRSGTFRSVLTGETSVQ